VLDLEYRFAPRRWAITPLVGVLGTDEGGYHLRAGFGRDFPLGERFSALVTFAAGFYDQGNGKDLGEHVQFRSALDLGVRLRRGLRLGVSVAHLSNASLEERNPGVETLTLTLAVVPGRLGPAAVRP
ncbi:MAG TPA: acyloxyacyl hydrolase, partial [Thermoanaerobaculia bacterium]|nr:acyloxyacyl hydrolase [Thermoanaerobaculia bacterium]